MLGSILVSAGYTRSSLLKFAAEYNKKGEVCQAKAFSQIKYTVLREHIRKHGAGAPVPRTPSTLRGQERVIAVIKEFTKYLYHTCTKSFGRKEVHYDHDGKPVHLTKLLAPYPKNYHVQEFIEYCRVNYGKEYTNRQGKHMKRTGCIREADLYMIYGVIVGGQLKNLGALDSAAQRYGPDNSKHITECLNGLQERTRGDDLVQEELHNVRDMHEKCNNFLRKDIKGTAHNVCVEIKDGVLDFPENWSCHHCPHFQQGVFDPRVLVAPEGALACGHIHTACCEQCEDAHEFPLYVEALVKLAESEGHNHIIPPELKKQVDYSMRKYRQVIF